MSAHKLSADFLKSWQTRLMADPGDAGTIAPNNNGLAVVALTSAGAETRTLNAPDAVGQTILIFVDTYVGDITLTIDSGVSGLTTFVFAAAGQTLKLEAITVAGVLKWQIVPGGGRQAALTAIDASTVDATYGAQEQAVLENLRTVVGEIKVVIQRAGLLA